MAETLSLKQYLQAKLEEIEHKNSEKAANVRRLEAQRNELNNQGSSSIIWDSAASEGRTYCSLGTSLLRRRCGETNGEE